MRGEPAVGAETLNQSRRTVQLPRTLVGLQSFAFPGTSGPGAPQPGAGVLVAGVAAVGTTTGACGTRTSTAATERLPTRSRRTLSAATLAASWVGGPMRSSLDPVWRVTESPVRVASVTCLRRAFGMVATPSRAGPAVSNVAPGAGGGPAPSTSGRAAGRSGRSAR